MNYLGGLLSGFLPRPGPEQALRQGLEYAVAVIGGHIDDGTVYVSALDAEAAEAKALFTPIYQRRGYALSAPLELVGFDVAPSSSNTLRDLFRTSGRAADVIRDNLSFNLIRGFAMPDEAARFAGAIVGGHVERPRAKRVKPSFRHRDTLLSAVAKRVSDAFGVPLGAAKPRYSNEVPPPVCGVTVAAAALRGFGVPIEWERADRVVRKYQKDIWKLENTGTLIPKRFHSTSNYLRAYSEPVFYASAEEFPEPLQKALAHFGINELLPRFYGEQ